MSKWGVRLMNSKPRAGPKVLADMLLAWRKRRWRSKNQRITLSGGPSNGALPFDNFADPLAGRRFAIRFKQGRESVPGPASRLRLKRTAEMIAKSTLEHRTLPYAEFILRPHPDCPSRAVRSIAVTARRDTDMLSLTYRVTGAIDNVLWPASAEPAFTDELWRHSCFEAFVGDEGTPRYVELNIAPSTEWAAYDFDDHRTGMRRASGVAVSGVVWQPAADVAELRATASLPGLAAANWDVALTTVIEERDGTKSFWALAHPAGPEDFHNRDCFTARLAAPSGA
uniref:DOMON-like domain-containing protein n=1 Tax=Sphingomonas bacterium TaxID=1895847 RepID=UPI0026075AF6|nr:DOMON-like domain-containing protein [Sphingomonas bacterium]